MLSNHRSCNESVTRAISDDTLVPTGRSAAISPGPVSPVLAQGGWDSAGDTGDLSTQNESCDSYPPSCGNPTISTAGGLRVATCAADTVAVDDSRDRVCKVV